MSAGSVAVELGILAAALAAGALFSGLEAAALAANRIGLRGPRGRVRQASEVLPMLNATQRILYASAIAQAVCITAAAFALDMVCHSVFWDGTRSNLGSVTDDLVVLAILLPLYLAVGRLAPRIYFSRRTESRLLSALAPVAWIPRLFVPALLWVTAVGRRFVARVRGGSPDQRPVKLTPDDLRELLAPSRQGGPRASIDKLMMYGIFGLEQTIVRELMQPLVNVAALRRDESTLKRVLSLALESGYSRIPVYTNRIINLDGVVEVPRLLRAGEKGSIADCVRPPYYVPETMHADQLLQKMIADDVDFAIVVDEYGGTVGVVTQEDVIEQIVGDIEDEFDPARPKMQREPDGSYLVDGRMDIDDINDRFGLSLPNEDFDTLGGYIYDVLGRVPKVGDMVAESGGARFEVTTMDGKRVERVKIRLAAPPGDKAPPDSPPAGE